MPAVLSQVLRATLLAHFLTISRVWLSSQVQRHSLHFRQQNEERGEEKWCKGGTLL